MTPEERILDYPAKLIPRGDALTILGTSHPARAAVDALPCAGNHKIGYCTGVVVDKAVVLALLRQPEGQ
jgi:hypothetical protein